MAFRVIALQVQGAAVGFGGFGRAVERLKQGTEVVPQAGTFRLNGEGATIGVFRFGVAGVFVQQQGEATPGGEGVFRFEADGAPTGRFGSRAVAGLFQ